MAAKVWTKERLDILISYLRNGMPTKQIAQKLDTSPDAISAAIRRYSLEEHKVYKPATTKFLSNLSEGIESLNDTNFEEQKELAKLKWKITKSNKKRQKSKPFEVGLFLPDAHIPHQNDSVIKAILKLTEDIKFDKFALLGDFMDLGCISHWNRNKHRTLEMRRLKEDYILGNSILDEFDKRLPQDCEKHYLEGNHEDWANQLLEEMPQLEGLVEPRELLYLDKRGYKFYPYNDIVKFGRLFVTHGMYVGANPIKKHLDELKVNIMFAHTHTQGMRLSASPAREIAFSGYNIGSICDLNPDFMRNRPSAWTHGFAVVYFFPNGYFDVQLVRVVKGSFIFNNKLYDGNI